MKNHALFEAFASFQALRWNSWLSFPAESLNSSGVDFQQDCGRFSANATFYCDTWGFNPGTFNPLIGSRGWARLPPTMLEDRPVFPVGFSLRWFFFVSFAFFIVLIQCCRRVRCGSGVVGRKPIIECAMIGLFYMRQCYNNNGNCLNKGSY